MRRTIPILAAASVVLALAGCGGSSRDSGGDMQRIAAFIQSDLTEKASADPLTDGTPIVIESVECIKDDSRHATCVLRASAGGETQERSVDVTYDSDNGDILYDVG